MGTNDQLIAIIESVFSLITDRHTKNKVEGYSREGNERGVWVGAAWWRSHGRPARLYTSSP